MILGGLAGSRLQQLRMMSDRFAGLVIVNVFQIVSNPAASLAGRTCAERLLELQVDDFLGAKKFHGVKEDVQKYRGAFVLNHIKSADFLVLISLLILFRTRHAEIENFSGKYGIEPNGTDLGGCFVKKRARERPFHPDRAA
jgi:hypothetical protein